MSYASRQDLVDRFGEEELVQLTDRPNAGVTADEVITKALGDADSEIDAYLTNRYTLPLSPVPAILQRMACDIARYYLYEDRVSEIVKTRYDAATRVLKDVAAGKASLGPDAAESESGDSVQFPDSQRVFAREPLE